MPSIDFASSMTVTHELLVTSKSISLPSCFAASTTHKVAAEILVPLCSAKTSVFILLLPHFLVYQQVDQQFQL